MKAVCLCHEARPVYHLDEIEYESPTREEEVALNFTKLCGYRLEKGTFDQDTSNLEFILRLPYKV